jgi:hypothetical protein
MMGNNLVRLVFFGEVLDGFDRNEVKAKLSVLLKLEEPQLSAVFSGQRVILKSPVASGEISRYVTHLESIGARVKVEPLSAEVESPVKRSATEDNDLPSPAGVGGSDEVTCPKCGERQPKRTLCRVCAADMPRVLAAKAEAAAEETARVLRQASEIGTTGGGRITASAVAAGSLPIELSSLPEGQKAWLPPVLGIALLAGLLAAMILSSGWVPLLDSANLAIHEAGHPLVGLFSDRLAVYGGTLFQLAFPLAVTFHFRRQSHLPGTGVGLVWLGENLHNVARYMADARVHELPLVGGGDHDWTEIFLRWGVLQLDTKIANLTHALGWLLMLLGVLWPFLFRNQAPERHDLS